VPAQPPAGDVVRVGGDQVGARGGLPVQAHRKHGGELGLGLQELLRAAVDQCGVRRGKGAVGDVVARTQVAELSVVEVLTGQLQLADADLVGPVQPGEGAGDHTAERQVAPKLVGGSEVEGHAGASGGADADVVDVDVAGGEVDARLGHEGPYQRTSEQEVSGDAPA